MNAKLCCYDVGSFPKGTALEEIEDLVGNVQEWTSTPADQLFDQTPWNGQPATAPKKLYSVGGDFETTPTGYKQTSDGVDAQSNRPSFRFRTLGFRCVEK